MPTTRPRARWVPPVLAATVVALLLGGCDDPPAPAVSRQLVLDAQGVVFAGSDGSHYRFPFGSSRAAVERMGAAVYGAEAARRA